MRTLFQRTLVVVSLLFSGMTPAAGQLPDPTERVLFSVPGPPSPTNFLGSYNGPLGSQTFRYWVVATYPRGQSSAAGPVTIGNAQTPSANGSVILNWRRPGGATSFSVLRSTTATFPTPCTCLVGTTTAGQLTDSGAALSAFTHSPVATATGRFELDNRNFADTRFVFTPALPSVTSLVAPTITPPLLFDSDGSAAAPVWSWTADPDNGPRRIAANQYSFSAGGTDVLLLSTSSVQALQSLRISDGTVGVPGIRFLSDLDSGMFLIGANNYAFSVGGVNLLELAAGAVTVTGTLSATPGGNVPSCALSTVTDADLTTASLTEDEILFTLPARGKLTAVGIKHSIAFSGGALLDLTVSIGDSSSTIFYTAAFDIFQAVSDTTFQDTDMFRSSTYAARDVLARFTSTTQQMNGITAGSVGIVACWVVLP